MPLVTSGEYRKGGLHADVVRTMDPSGITAAEYQMDDAVEVHAVALTTTPPVLPDAYSIVPPCIIRHDASRIQAGAERLTL